jgi:hypothetical protein
MILEFLVSVVLFAPLLFMKKKLLRRHWYILFSIGLIFALLLSFVSVWSVWSLWNPYASIASLPSGNYSGTSAVSYPLSMNMHVVNVLLYNTSVGWNEVVRNVSFSVFIANVKVLQGNGTSSYYVGSPLMLKRIPTKSVNYEFGAPFFSNIIAFLSFLQLLFTLFNIVGFMLGMILCYVVSRMIESKSIDHLC